MRSINDILSGVVSQIAPVIEITNVVDNADGTYTLTVCDVFYIQKCFTVEIQGNNYTVTDIVGKDITVSGTILPTTGTFNLYLPYFFHGTVTQTNVELSKQEDAANKTPMVYSLETLRETFFDPDESSLELEAEVRLFFLTQANFQDWETTDYYSDAIAPMKALADEFLKVLTTYQGIGFIEDRELISHTKFGVFLNDKGYEKFLFNDHLSGVEMRITIPVVSTNICVQC